MCVRERERKKERERESTQGKATGECVRVVAGSELSATSRTHLCATKLKNIKIMPHTISLELTAWKSPYPTVANCQKNKEGEPGW